MYIAKQHYKIGRLHPALDSVQTSSNDIHRLPVKQRLLTGTYILQSNKAIFNQLEVNPICLLCQEYAETLDHFILSCQALATARDTHIARAI